MKNLWKYIKVLITIAILIFFVYYFIENQEDFLLVLSTPVKYLIMIAIPFGILVLLDGVFIKVILKTFNQSISVLESFYVSNISYLGNYFLPMRGGAVIRSVYLKKNFNFPYTYFVSTLYGFYIIVFLVNSFLGLVALLVIQFKYGVVSIPLYVFFGLLFLLMLLLSLFKFPTEKINQGRYRIVNKVLKIIKDIFNGWNIIISNKQLLISLILITIAKFVVSAFLFFIEFTALGIESNFVNVLLYNCLSGVSLLVSLTPGSLGVREGIFVITSDILGISNEQVMQLALLDRGMVVITLVVLFIILYILQKVFKKKDELKEIISK